MQELEKSLNELCDGLPFQTSWYLKDLTTGQRADRLGDVPVPSASTRKISIMMAALKAVHDGKLALDQKVTIEAKYQDNDSGTFQHLTPGFWITFRDALVMMIIVSDNTCTGTVVDLVGLDAVQRFCDSIGMTGTTHRFGIPPRLGPDHSLDQVTTTTPNDQGLLLELILHGTTDPAVAARLGSTPELCRLGPRHPELAKAQDAPALPVAARHQGRAQDGDRLARVHGRGHRLPRRSPAVHPHRLHGARPGRATRRNARLHRRLSAHRPHGPALLRRAGTLKSGDERTRCHATARRGGGRPRLVRGEAPPRLVPGLSLASTPRQRDNDQPLVMLCDYR